jgi:hypothetical protein
MAELPPIEERDEMPPVSYRTRIHQLVSRNSELQDPYDVLARRGGLAVDDVARHPQTRFRE